MPAADIQSIRDLGNLPAGGVKEYGTAVSVIDLYPVCQLIQGLGKQLLLKIFPHKEVVEEVFRRRKNTVKEGIVFPDKASMPGICQDRKNRSDKAPFRNPVLKQKTVGSPRLFCTVFYSDTFVSVCYCEENIKKMFHN